MNCRKVVNLISAYVDGELTGAESLELRHHICNCKTCGEELEQVRRTKQLLANLSSVSCREGFAGAIISRLDEVKIPGYVRLFNGISALLHRRVSNVGAVLVASGIAVMMFAVGNIGNFNYDYNRMEMFSNPVAELPQYIPSSYSEMANDGVINPPLELADDSQSLSDSYAVVNASLW